MPTGTGRTLGAALFDLFRQESSGRARGSYTAQSWHAQLRALTDTAAGRAAADRAGLAPTARTLLGWLSETQTPNKANRDRIRDAYDALKSGFGNRLKTAKYEIKGIVKVGRDSRERGGKGVAPLRVDGSQGDWERLEQAWNEGAWHGGTVHEATIEQLFVEDVINGDLGDPSEPWAFPGSSYTVTI